MLTPERIKQLDEIAGVSTPTPTRVNPNIEAGRQWANELKQFANQGKEQRSAKSYSASFPAKTGEKAGIAALKTVGNIPSSTYNLGKGLFEAVTHPKATITGLKRTAVGAGESLGRTLVEKTKLGDIEVEDGKTARENLPEPGIDEQTYKAVIDIMKERYGSRENFQRTVTNDPVGVGADVLALLEGGAGLASKVPGVTSTVAKVTAPLSELRTAGRAKVAGVVQKSAEGNIAKVLEPTKEAMKVQTQRMLPELAKRNKVALTRKGLSEKFAAEADAAGQAIDEAWEALPEGTHEKIKPIVDALEESKNKFIVDGKIVDESAYTAADKLQKVILEVSKDGESIPSASLRKVRQIWDESIARSKGFTKDLSEQDTLAIKKEATSAIRKVLSESHPEIAKLNKEYTLWKGAEDVLNETIKRKTGKGLFGDNAAVMAGSGIGTGTAFGGLKGALAVTGAIGLVAVAMRSTLWKTLSAAAKNKLAKAIIEAKPVEVRRILAPIIGGQVLDTVKESSDRVNN